MSPLAINIMLHYYCSPLDYATNGSKGEDGTVTDLFCHGMLQEDRQEGTDSKFRISEKGRAYVDALLSVQEPVCKWEVSLGKAKEDK